MDRLTNGNTGVVIPTHSADCNTYQFHCEDCDCKVMDCGFLRDALNCLCDYENTGLTPEDVPSALEMSKIYVALQKLKAYEQAEAEGRLIVLPCKVGDTVWYLTGGNSSHSQHFSVVEESVCTGIFVEDEKMLIRLRYDWKGNHGSYGVFGKTVFTSREAAEAALKEVRG